MYKKTADRSTVNYSKQGRHDWNALMFHEFWMSLMGNELYHWSGRSCFLFSLTLLSLLPLVVLHRFHFLSLSSSKRWVNSRTELIITASLSRESPLPQPLVSENVRRQGEWRGEGGGGHKIKVLPFISVFPHRIIISCDSGLHQWPSWSPDGRLSPPSRFQLSSAVDGASLSLHILCPRGHFPFKGFVHPVLRTLSAPEQQLCWIKTREWFLIATCWRNFTCFLSFSRSLKDPSSKDHSMFPKRLQGASVCITWGLFRTNRKILLGTLFNLQELRWFKLIPGINTWSSSCVSFSFAFSLDINL